MIGKVAPKRTPTMTAGKPKAKGNGNGNIMSFFKRAESTSNATMKEEEDSLFVEDNAVKLEGGVPIQTPTPPREELEGVDEDVNMARERSPLQRYNEDPGPIKRRRTEEPSPQLPRQDEVRKMPRRGPFVDDSDSDEEELPPFQVSDHTDNAIKQGDEIQTSAPRDPTPVHVDKPPEEQTKEIPVPQLKQESTSVGEVNDFDGIDDFIDEEFPEEGEEYMERRWMEEQAELEMGMEEEDQDVEGTIEALKEDCGESAAVIPQDTGSSICPICGGSTIGMVEQVCPVNPRIRLGLTRYSKSLSM